MNHPHIDSLLRFMDASVCNFWAVATLKQWLSRHGYRERQLADSLNDVQPGEKFFVTKNDSALFAVRVGRKSPAETGFKIIAAHSDSPCFRVKPNAA
ncbi:MAG: M18 family aminopeptidase, partial [Muribaculaceae bacterium]|nr:M18 family aminopeptidase [Muribaculaceae bacterium]